jgi:LppX/LprAFG-like lipoprotein
VKESPVLRTLTRRRGTARYSLVAAPALLTLLALAVLAGCGEAAPSAQTLLQNAKTTFNATKSFHFVLNVAHPGAGSIDAPVVTDAKGDVQRPDEVSATATVDAGLANLAVKVIVVGDKQWYTNPLTGKFEPTTQFTSYERIFDAQIGIGTLLTKLQHPSTPADGSANGTSCWKVTGTLAQADLAPIFGDTVKSDLKNVAVCVGKSDNRIYSVVIPGVIIDGDTADTVHTFYLSNFDQSVTIATPAPGE